MLVYGFKIGQRLTRHESLTQVKIHIDFFYCTFIKKESTTHRHIHLIMYVNLYHNYKRMKYQQSHP